MGLEAVFNDFFTPLMQDFESWRAVPETFLDAGDHVIALRHYHSRDKATGKDMTAGFAHVWSLDQGKAARLRHCADNSTVGACTGVFVEAAAVLSDVD